MNDENKVEEVPQDGPMVEEGSAPDPMGDIGPGPETVGEASSPPVDDQGEPDVEDEVFDLDEVDENAPDFEPMPAGWYKFRITGQKYTSSKAGDPMMVTECTCIDAEKPQFQGRRVSQWALFKYNGKANDPIAKLGVKRFKQLMIRAGVPIDFKTFRPKEFIESGAAIGKDILLQLGIGDPRENNEGQMVRDNNIKQIKPTGSGDAFLSD